MTNTDPYQAYVQDALLDSSPTHLVTMLYERAVEMVKQAQRCLESGDVWGRSAAVSKTTHILTELLVSLDHEKGGRLAANLGNLYGYMQCKLVEAHAQKSPALLREVEQLLSTLLEGWYKVAEEVQRSASTLSAPAYTKPFEAQDVSAPVYGDYFAESELSSTGMVLSF